MSAVAQTSGKGIGTNRGRLGTGRTGSGDLMSAIKDPRTVITERIRRDQREGALTAAAILKFAPEIMRDERVGDWLERIGHGTISDTVVDGWLARARINPRRRANTLSVQQRYLLSGLLHLWAKGQAC